jgi:hypothetical protein
VRTPRTTVPGQFPSTPSDSIGARSRRMLALCRGLCHPTHQMRTGWFSVLGCVVGAIVACSEAKSNDASEPADISTEDADDFATALGTAFCEGIAECCAATSLPSDTASCKSLLTTQLSVSLSRIASLKYAYDASAATACIKAYRTGLVACTDPEAMDAAEEACSGVFLGTVPLGGACSESGECIETNSQYVSCDTGICTAPSDGYSLSSSTHGTLGDPCQASCRADVDGGASCRGSADGGDSKVTCWVNDGLVCGSGGTCVAAPALGETCSDYCAEGAYCDGGLCVEPTATGSCLSDEAACLSTSYCARDTSICTPKKANGVACDDDEECDGRDCYGDVCRSWTVASPQTCSGLLDD